MYGWPGSVYEAPYGADDGCFDIRSAEKLNGIFVGQIAYGAGALANGYYNDFVMTPPDWAAYYNGLITGGNWKDVNGQTVTSCGWYLNLTMHYSPYAPVDYPYTQVQNGMVVNGVETAYRAGVPYAP
jgi:hypothetical protein